MIFTFASSSLSVRVPLRTRIFSKNDRVKTLAKSLGGVANAARGQISIAATQQTRIPPVAANHPLRALAFSVASRSVVDGVLIFICMLLDCFKTSFTDSSAGATNAPANAQSKQTSGLASRQG